MMALGSDGDAKRLCWGMEKRGKRVLEQNNSIRKEEKPAISKLKVGKTLGINGIRTE